MSKCLETECHHWDDASPRCCTLMNDHPEIYLSCVSRIKAFESKVHDFIKFIENEVTHITVMVRSEGKLAEKLSEIRDAVS